MSGLNGHGNGSPKGGSMGGVTPTRTMRGTSAHLQLLRKMVEDGQMAAADLEVAAAFCRRLLVDKETTLSPRDRNNAAKTLTTISKTRADVAIALDKIERLEVGEDTERHGITVRYANEESVRMGELLRG